MPYDWTERDRAQWRSYAQGHNWNLHEFAWNKRKALDAVDAPKVAHQTMFEALHTWAHEHSLVQRIVGLRAQESAGRRMLLGRRGESYVLKDGTAVLAPLASWRTEDVWAYIVLYDLPVLEVYEQFGAETRSGMIGSNGVAYGRIARLREHFPDFYLRAREEVDYALQLS